MAWGEKSRCLRRRRNEDTSTAPTRSHLCVIALYRPIAGAPFAFVLLVVTSVQAYAPRRIYGPRSSSKTDVRVRDRRGKRSRIALGRRRHGMTQVYIFENRWISQKSSPNSSAGSMMQHSMPRCGKRWSARPRVSSADQARRSFQRALSPRTAISIASTAPTRTTGSSISTNIWHSTLPRPANISPISGSRSPYRI